MENELKPCPFCGAKYYKDDEDFWYAADHEPWCLLGGGTHGLSLIFTHEDVDAWNRRVNDGRPDKTE